MTLRFGFNGVPFDDAEPRFIALYGGPSGPPLFWDRIMHKWHESYALRDQFARQGLVFDLPEVGAASEQWRDQNQGWVASAYRGQAWAESQSEATLPDAAAWLLEGDVWSDVGVWVDAETWDGVETAGQQRADLNFIIATLPGMSNRVADLEAA